MITLDGTSGITNDATDLNYTGTLTGGTGVVNLGSGQFYKDASGNVGIGTSSLATNLQVAGSTGLTLGAVSGNAWRTAAIVPIDEGDSYKGALAFYTHPSAGSAGAPTERARIDSSGNFLNNCTGITGDAPNAAGGRYTEANGNCKVRVTSNGNPAFQFYSPSGGTGSPVGSVLVNASTTSYVTSSDYRLKENIAPMTGALAKVTALKPCTYVWKATGEADEGFIAHELQEVCPSAVTGDKDAVNEDGSIKPQGIDTSFLVATLTAAIQEQQALITSLTARVVALEGQA